MAQKTSLIVNILRGDAKVLIACSLDQKDTKNLAGFTIQCQPKGFKNPYYLLNKLQFADPEGHAQVVQEPGRSSINAPIQKFRWLHVPGGVHQMGKVVYGEYVYIVTPRYFEKEKLLPIDKSLGITVATTMAPFEKGKIELGFTRGFVQSQAFINHFGPNTLFKPKKAELLFDTSQQAGINNQGEAYSFADEYIWSGFTARQKIFDLVKEVMEDKSLFLDVFAYDLSEPDLMGFFLALAREGRIRMILDNAALHHDTKKPKPEDQFEAAFVDAIKDTDGKPSTSLILRGNFSRYQHNKVFIVSSGKNRTPVKIMSGSTNFSVTGMYVNSNHIIIFKDKEITALYLRMFEEVLSSAVSSASFIASDLSSQEFAFGSKDLPEMAITFAPHGKKNALGNLDKMVDRINSEKSSVLFAVMGTDPKTTGPVAPALIELHERTDIFSCGITDSTNSLTFYKPSSATGIRVSGKPGKTLLPPPFDQEISVGIGHQVHHKFVVCGFNTPDAVVWLGSSNLALGGEMSNGDNLIEIRDRDIATVFALEALALVDHFHFRDGHPALEATQKSKSATDKKPTVKVYNLYTDDKWAKSYYKKGDYHFIDRELFSGKVPG